MSRNVVAVHETSLYNNSGLKDAVFASAVRDWMAQRMPMMPRGLLSTDTEHWEVEQLARFVVEDEQEFTCFVCTGCDERLCVLPEGGAPSCPECAEPGVEPPAVRSEVVEGYAVRDTEDNCLLSPATTLTREDEEVPTADGIVSVFILERDAEREVEAQLRRLRETSDDDIPWMHSWFFLPDNSIRTETLQQAGFVVAQYSGGSGQRYRLAGVNGVGYNHEACHHAKLYVLHHFDTVQLIPTQLGQTLVVPLGASADALQAAMVRVGL